MGEILFRQNYLIKVLRSYVITRKVYLLSVVFPNGFVQYFLINDSIMFLSFTVEILRVWGCIEGYFVSGKFTSI